ncbi:MAG: hypothetical protein Q8O16_00990 [Dehalococcoidia bacterium]|nr:hypothetical protein [Dehalococcoidia bacterium]
MKLTNNVYVETKYSGANVSYVSTKDGVVMIDSPQKPNLEVKCSGVIEVRSRTLIFLSKWAIVVLKESIGWLKRSLCIPPAWETDAMSTVSSKHM